MEGGDGADAEVNEIVGKGAVDGGGEQPTSSVVDILKNVGGGEDAVNNGRES